MSYAEMFKKRNLNYIQKHQKIILKSGFEFNSLETWEQRKEEEENKKNKKIEIKEGFNKYDLDNKIFLIETIIGLVKSINSWFLFSKE